MKYSKQKTLYFLFYRSRLINGSEKAKLCDINKANNIFKIFLNAHPYPAEAGVHGAHGVRNVWD